MKFDFIKPTLVFTLVGFFIPGFTAIGLLGLQILLGNFGIECSIAWTMMWKATSIAGLVLPFLFYLNVILMTPDRLQSLKIQLTLFNLLEYIFIQSSLAPLFTNAQTSCYASDGQNGIELAFTAWMALPILLIFSYIFKRTFEANNRQE